MLLAYSTADIVALLPLTPGGLGIVDASMSGLLILAGVYATYAFLATLAYRIASPLAPLLARPPAYLLFRLCYGRPVPRRTTPGEGGQPSAGSQAQSPRAVRKLRLQLYSAGQCHESRRHLSAGGLAGWNGYHAELD